VTLPKANTRVTTLMQLVLTAKTATLTDILTRHQPR